MPAGPVRLGLLLIASRPLKRLISLARTAESAGFQHLWVPDERFYRDPFVVATAASRATQQIRVGPCVLDPYTRLPALSAVALASLDEASGGRVCVAVGAGASGFRALDVHRDPPPAPAVRQMVEDLRLLWRGGQIGEIALAFRPVQPNLPVYIAAEGPAMLRLAGEIGDGVILQAKVSEPLVRHALAELHVGLDRAGRNSSDLEVVFRVDVAVADRLKDAYALLRHRVARRLVAASPEFAVFRTAGLEVTARMRTAVAGVGYTNDRALLERIGDLVDDRFVDAFCVAATPSTLGARLDDLVRLGAGQILINPVAAKGGEDHLLHLAGAWRQSLPPTVVGD